MMHWTEDQLKQHIERMNSAFPTRVIRGSASVMREDKPEKTSKHRAIPAYLDGERFDSQLEAREWEKLKLLEVSGEICALRRQVRFSLFGPGGEHLQVYKADFVFNERVDGVWKRVVADAKSGHTKALATWPKIKRLMQMCHGIEVRELP